MTYRIPFNRPYLSGNEFDYMREAIANQHVSGDGPFTHRCQRELEKILGSGRVLLTTSCTHALEMTALLLAICPGDEVIVPAFTFVSTINAFVLRGARPVFADIRADTLNLDECQLERLITDRTKVIVTVHYGGIGCEMSKITEIARRYGLSIVEDNAHGLFASYKGQALGTFGCLATLSFHETKNVHCGEGGALIINDDHYIERAEIIREKGTDRSRFFRGQIDKYTWMDLGSSYVLSDLLAAFLFAQLQQAHAIQEKRKRVWSFYWENLKDWAAERSVQIPLVPPHCDPAYHIFYLITPAPEWRSALIAHLNALQINTVFHYLPLHLSNMGRRFGGKSGDCPVTERISERLLRLPFYSDMTEDEQRIVVSAVQNFRAGKARTV